MAAVWVIINNRVFKRDDFIIWGVADSVESAAELTRKRFQSVEIAWNELTRETDDSWLMTGHLQKAFITNDLISFRFQQFTLFTGSVVEKK